MFTTVRESLSDIASLVTSGDGTTDEQPQQAMESLQVGETDSPSETEIVTEPSVTKSSLRSKDLPGLSIKMTQCCGQYTVSGFQYKRDPDAADLVFGIDRTFTNNKETNERICAERETAYAAYFKEHGHGNYITGDLPHDTYVTLPSKMPGMLVFTWNHTSYLEYAKRFDEFIRKHGLGECTITGTAYNPNSHNTIQCLVWCVHQEGYEKFIKDNP
jgi:hypothetical protein